MHRQESMKTFHIFLSTFRIFCYLWRTYLFVVRENVSFKLVDLVISYGFLIQIDDDKLWQNC